MTKEEILQVCNWDLDKAKEMFNWLGIADDVPVCPILAGAVAPQPGMAHKSFVLFKDGSRSYEPVSTCLENIKGIFIWTAAGRYVGVFPKYKECQMLADGKERNWKAKELEEYEALQVTPEQAIIETRDLAKLRSEAALFVQEMVGKNGFIPEPLTLTSVMAQRDEINRFAKRICGADILEKQSAWSVVRSYTYRAWSFLGYSGYVYNYGLCYSGLTVPCVLA